MTNSNISAQTKPTDVLFSHLQTFSEMPAFELLSGAAARTYFGGISGATADLTVSQLADLSALELSALRLTQRDVHLIIDQLAKIIPTPVTDPAPTESETTTDLSSVAQDQLLTTTLGELAVWQGLTIHGVTPLGKFWVDNGTRAPFEEMITLSQLARMSSRSLLAKRSMTPAKIVAITNAVRHAMRELSLTSPANSSAVVSPAVVHTTAEHQIMLEEQAFSKRLLAAALNELTPQQRARVFSIVAGPYMNQTQTKKINKKQPKRNNRNSRKAKAPKRKPSASAKKYSASAKKS